PYIVARVVSLKLAYSSSLFVLVFVLIHTSTPDISTLSLHDALPICNFFFNFRTNDNDFGIFFSCILLNLLNMFKRFNNMQLKKIDRKSTRLNSSHVSISYAVFCLKKKNKCKETN